MLDFNSHAHVERDKEMRSKTIEAIISTHTLTWSVTIPCSFSSEFEFISTHTLTWSVTKENYVNFSLKIISTHTLTWSVTFKVQS